MKEKVVPRHWGRAAGGCGSQTGGSGNGSRDPGETSAQVQAKPDRSRDRRKRYSGEKSKRRRGSMSRERWDSSTTPSFSSLTCHSLQEEMQSEELRWDLTEPRTWPCQGGTAAKVQSLDPRLDILHNHTGVGRCHKLQASFLLLQRYLTVRKQTQNENNSRARTRGQMKLGGGRITWWMCWENTTESCSVSGLGD